MIALVKEAHRPADPIRCHIPPGRIAHGTIWWIFHTVFCRIQRAVIEILTKKGQAFPAYRQRPSASRAADIVHTSERHPQGMCRKTADHSTMTQSRTSCSSAGRMLLSAPPLYPPDGCLQGRKKNPAAQCRPATRQIRRLSSRGTLWHRPAADGAPSGASQAGTFPDPAHDFFGWFLIDSLFQYPV